MSETPTISKYDGDVRWIPASAAGAALKVSRQRVYQLIESGALVHCRFGRSVLVSQRSVDARAALLDREEENTHAHR